MTPAQKQRRRRISSAKYRLEEAITAVVALSDDEINELVSRMRFDALTVIAAILSDRPGPLAGPPVVVQYFSYLRDQEKGVLPSAPTGS